MAPDQSKSTPSIEASTFQEIFGRAHTARLRAKDEPSTSEELSERKESLLGSTNMVFGTRIGPRTPVTVFEILSYLKAQGNPPEGYSLGSIPDPIDLLNGPTVRDEGAEIRNASLYDELKERFRAGGIFDSMSGKPLLCEMHEIYTTYRHYLPIDPRRRRLALSSDRIATEDVMKEQLQRVRELAIDIERLSDLNLIEFDSYVPLPERPVVMERDPSPPPKRAWVELNQQPRKKRKRARRGRKHD